jgi:hypothetical protein
MESSYEKSSTMVEKLKLGILNLTRLRKCAKLMTNIQRMAFEKKYGKI